MSPTARPSLTTAAIAYVATLILFVCIDFVWLSTMSDRLYKPVLGPLLAADFALGPAVLFYLLYAAGLTALAVWPAVTSGAGTSAPRLGAIVGFTAYATYDLTNQATLVHWSTTLTLADLAWGTLLSGVVATLATMITRRLAR